MANRILLLEDDSTLRGQLMTLLSDRGLIVDCYADGESGLQRGLEGHFDVAIIDLGLPKTPGLEVVRELRAQGVDAPILILTARTDWSDKVEGLDAGADDYLAKPFHLEELVARINALLRRARGEVKSSVTLGALTIDLREQQAYLHDEPLQLTTYEYKLLHYLTTSAGQTLSKGDLADYLYDVDGDRDSNVIEVLVGRLRKKLQPAVGQPAIETLRGRGYRLHLSDA
ncbi:MAG: response regulator transcription factor [Gammaproteobacteria bacterium]|jgi:two-component system response regulator PhoP